MPKIKVYSKSNCMQCKFVKKWLTDNNLPFEEINVEESQEALVHVRDNLNMRSLPVVEATGIEPFSGFNQTALKELKSTLGE